MLDSARNWVIQHKWCLVACSVLSVAGYGAGRFGTPTKVETVEVVKVVTKEVEKKVTVTGPIRWKTQIRTVQGPQGPERVVEREVWKDPRVEYVDREVVKRETEVQTKVVEHDAPRLTLGATVAWDGAPAYGGFLTYRVAGPLVLLGQGEGGAAGWSARAGVGISF